MRLSCPNCGAQYEVPVDVIPRAGRDVQCSNCGHTWFQIHPDDDIELAEEVSGSTPEPVASPGGAHTEDRVTRETAEDPATSDDGDEVQPPEMFFDEEEPAPTEDERPEEPTESEDDPQDTPSEEDDSPDHEDTSPAWDNDASQDEAAEEEHSGEDESHDDETPAPEDHQQGEENEGEDLEAEEWEEEASDDRHDDDEDAGDDTDEGTDSEAQRRELDPAIANVLQEEAEFEAQAREAENRETLETQTELGLDQGGDEDQRAAEARARMRRIRGLPEGDEADLPPNVEDTAGHESRRDLLPDIEEINSTLRSTDERTSGEAAAAAMSTRARQRGGFRLGFGIAMLIAALLILTYVYSGQIVEAYPPAAPVIESYMASMNSARVWLDTLVSDGMLWLDDKAQKAGGETN